MASCAVGNARMIHGVDLHGQAILACPGSAGHVETIPRERAHDLLAVGDLHAVEPHVGPIVDPLEVEPNVLPLEQCRQIELGAIPIGIFPGIPLVGQMAELGQIVLGLLNSSEASGMRKAFRPIRRSGYTPLRVRAVSTVAGTDVANQSLGVNSWVDTRLPSSLTCDGRLHQPSLPQQRLAATFSWAEVQAIAMSRIPTATASVILRFIQHSMLIRVWRRLGGRLPACRHASAPRRGSSPASDPPETSGQGRQ